MATAARGQIIHRLVGHRPLVALPDGLILARGADLFHWTRGGQPPRWVAGLELEPFEARTMAPRLLQRLTRSGPQCGAVAGPGRLVVASKRALFEVDLVRHASRRMECAARGRPLNLVSIEGVPGFADQVCFGEYLGNPGCAPVSI